MSTNRWKLSSDWKRSRGRNFGGSERESKQRSSLVEALVQLAQCILFGSSRDFESCEISLFLASLYRDLLIQVSARTEASQLETFTFPLSIPSLPSSTLSNLSISLSFPFPPFHIRPASLEELLLLRSLQKRPTGIDLNRLNQGEKKKKKKKQAKDPSEMTEDEKWQEKMNRGGLVDGGDGEEDEDG